MDKALLLQHTGIWEFNLAWLLIENSSAGAFRKVLNGNYPNVETTRVERSAKKRMRMNSGGADLWVQPICFEMWQV